MIEARQKRISVRSVVAATTSFLSFSESFMTRCAVYFILAVVVLLLLLIWLSFLLNGMGCDVIVVVVTLSPYPRCRHEPFLISMVHFLPCASLTSRIGPTSMVMADLDSYPILFMHLEVPACGLRLLGNG